MNDIKLFGDKEIASKEAKGEKTYYADHEIIRKTSKNRTLIYILGVALLLSVAGLGFYDYMQDKYFNETFQTFKTNFQQDISSLSSRIDALLSRVISLEKRITNVEKKTDENTSQIGETQENVSQLQDEMQDANSKIVAMQYTEKDAERLALMFASQFEGIEVDTYNYNSSTNRWEVTGITFDQNAPARRVSDEVVGITKTESGYDVVLLLGYQGFKFTNGVFYFKMTVNVGFKGAVEGYSVVFSHG